MTYEEKQKQLENHVKVLHENFSSVMIFAINDTAVDELGRPMVIGQVCGRGNLFATAGQVRKWIADFERGGCQTSL